MGGTMTRMRRKPVEITKENIAEFMQQFDALVSDCDGVIWYPGGEIPHAREGLEALRAAGKKMLFATNNSVLAPSKKFERLGFPIQQNELVHPALALARHLEKIGFNKIAYVLGVENFKDELRSRGIKVLPESRGGLIIEDLAGMLNGIDVNPEIGAIIVDLDVNVTYMELVTVLNNLRRQDCLFFAGATDAVVTFPSGKMILGPGPFIRILEDCSGRKAEVIGKPGSMMVDEFLKDVHNLDMKRTIFVGDTLAQDMGCANACGMKKLLVLTGMTKLPDLDTCDPELIPDYYINSIGDFHHLLAQRET